MKRKRYSSVDEMIRDLNFDDPEFLKMYFSPKHRFRRWVSRCRVFFWVTALKLTGKI